MKGLFNLMKTQQLLIWETVLTPWEELPIEELPQDLHTFKGFLLLAFAESLSHVSLLAPLAYYSSWEIATSHKLS